MLTAFPSPLWTVAENKNLISAEPLDEPHCGGLAVASN